MLQYNVTVIGMDKSGRATKGSNMLQFTTPSLPTPPAPPARSLTLTSAKAVSQNRGTATATPQPSGLFVKVNVCANASLAWPDDGSIGRVRLTALS